MIKQEQKQTYRFMYIWGLPIDKKTAGVIQGWKTLKYLFAEKVDVRVVCFYTVTQKGFYINFLKELLHDINVPLQLSNTIIWVPSINIPKIGAVFRNVFLQKTLRTALRDNGPYLFYSRNYLSLSPLLKDLAPGSRVAVEVHHPDHYRPGYDYYFYISRPLEEYIAFPAKCFLPDSVDEDDYADTSTSYDFADAMNAFQIKIGFSGSLYRDRGVDNLIRAYCDIEKKYQNAAGLFIMGGSSDEIAQYTGLAKTIGIKNIFFFGSRSLREVARFNQLCDLLVISYSNQLKSKDYCSPLKLFEYFYAKKPIVASRLGYLEDFKQSSLSQSLFLYDPNSIEECAATIEYVIKNLSAIRGTVEKMSEQELIALTYRYRIKRMLSFLEGDGIILKRIDQEASA